MNISFKLHRGLIVVQAELFGPAGSIVLRLALDTGATGTLINVAPLATIGYDPSLSQGRIQVTTGSGVEYAPQIPMIQVKAIGQERNHFPVLAHTLPVSAGIDGLLGLDFMRGQVLTIDFRKGILSLSSSEPNDTCR